MKGLTGVLGIGDWALLGKMELLMGWFDGFEFWSWLMETD